MSPRMCVIDVPGLSRPLIDALPAGSALQRLLAARPVVDLLPTWPAVTCSVQATLTTGKTPREHGIVANGIATYRSPRDQGLVDASNFGSYRREVSFWEQSSQFLDVNRFWQDASGRSRWKTALLFFQQSMPGFAGAPRPAADVVVTPRPQHGPDGQITSLLWTDPPELAAALTAKLGAFPLMNYWGPLAGIASSRWIASAAAHVWEVQQPQLQLVYVPHLDYDLQRFGPDSPQARAAVVELSAAIEPLLRTVSADGRIIVLSEYAIAPVSHCVQLNLALRNAGLLKTSAHADGALVDYHASQAFAMIDHQIAHIYLNGIDAQQGMQALEGLPLRVLSNGDRIEHPRAGDLQIEADAGVWFDYRWWEKESEAPAFAAQVDIHRKPGYDPLELFFDPATRSISQDVTRLRGSHGRDGASSGILSMEWDSEPASGVELTELSRLIGKKLG